MSNTDKNNHSTEKKSRRKFLVLFIVLILIIIGVVGGLYINKINLEKNKSDNEQSQEKGFGEGTGGDTATVSDYNTQAVAAWKSGDKKKAQDLAKKGLEEAKNLTPEQVKQLPGSIDLSYNLQMMSEGKRPTQ